MPVDVLVVDDGSQDAHARPGPRGRGRGGLARRVARPGRRPAHGLEHARDAGYAAAVYLDGDGEYDAAELARVLEPVARGRADYVLGSRFLGAREGMSWHRDLANRATTALLGTLMGTVLTDGQTGYRAFSAKALRAARINHDYNYAQVLTLSLWGAGIDPVEVPITYRRRSGGRSFVPYPEYFARVTPALWRQFRASRTARAAPRRRSRRPARTARPTRRSAGTARSAGRTARPGAGSTSPPSPAAPPGRATPTRPPSAPPARSRCAAPAQAPGHQRHRQRQRGQQVPGREPVAEHRGGQEAGHQQLRAQRGGAHGGGALHRAQAGHGQRQLVAAASGRAATPTKASRNSGAHRSSP